MSLSILIVTYNRPEDTLALLENIAAQQDVTDHVGEVLLLNNASTVPYSSVTDFIASNPQLNIEYIDHHENLGVARGRNFLIEKAKYEYLLVIDDDIIFEHPDALKKADHLFLEEKYRKNNTAVITLNIFYFDNHQRQESAFPHKRIDRYVDKDWFLTAYFIGAAHLMQRSLFEKTGLYPPDFFYGMEEYDLSYRVIDAGYTLAFDNSINILHKESPLGRQANYKKLHMQWVNKSKVAWRYLPFIYFISTAFLWSFQYLKNAPAQPGWYFKSWGMIMAIPFKEKRRVLSAKSLEYLKKVEARLWF